ncbi:MAG: hypothetical protein ABII00_11855 [Elusimicrobiota bacterium]
MDTFFSPPRHRLLSLGAACTMLGTALFMGLGAGAHRALAASVQVTQPVSGAQPAAAGVSGAGLNQAAAIRQRSRRLSAPGLNSVLPGNVSFELKPVIPAKSAPSASLAEGIGAKTAPPGAPGLTAAPQSQPHSGGDRALRTSQSDDARTAAAEGTAKPAEGKKARVLGMLKQAQAIFSKRIKDDSRGHQEDLAEQSRLYDGGKAFGPRTEDAVATSERAGAADLPQGWRLRAMEPGRLESRAPLAARPARQSIAYAPGIDGTRTPVLDITHPEMAPAYRFDDPLLGWKSILLLKAIQALPGSLREAIARRSAILADFIGKREYLNGFSTYLAKLGKRHVPGGIFDKLATGSKHAVAVVYRLRDFTDQHAGALAEAVRRNPRADTIRFVNIAGGPAPDSINTVLKVLADPARAGSLAGKKIRIAVFDFNTDGPAFGKRSVAALKRPGMKLEDVDIELEHIPYDWNDPSAMASRVRQWKREGDILVGGTEGGLMEYGSDEAISRNLRALHETTPEDFRFTFSNYKSRDEIHPAVTEMLKIADMGWQLRGQNGGKDARGRTLKGIRRLVEENGWVVETSVTGRDIFDVLTIRKADAPPLRA